jgi:hypothetical protein
MQNSWYTANTIINQNKTAFLHVYEKTLELQALRKKRGLRRDGKSVLEHHKEGM